MGNCPFCDSEDCTTEQMEDGTLVVCKTYGTCLIGDSIKMLSHYHDKTLLNKILCKIVEILVRKSKFTQSANLNFAYAPNRILPQKWINLSNYVDDEPMEIFDRVDNALLNLGALYKEPGKAIAFSANLAPIFYCPNLKSNQDGVAEFILFLQNLNYVSPIGNKKIVEIFNISPNGWKRIQELRKNESLSKQGFIAMSFSDETKDISQVFCQSIQEIGYAPMRIDEKEHNNQIVPEILHEISKSKFLVIDLTYPNYGAYYEAGYALGLGKEVIACCRKAEFDDPEKKPHFDLYQKNMVVWTDLDDLKQRLIRRIEATVK